MNRTVLLGAIVFLTLPVCSLAGEASESKGNRGDWAKKGRVSVQLFSGLLYSPVYERRARPTLNYSLSAVRIGYVFTETLYEDSPLCGNLEWLGEVVFSSVFKGAGDYMAGMSILLR